MQPGSSPAHILVPLREPAAFVVAAVAADNMRSKAVFATEVVVVALVLYMARAAAAVGAAVVAQEDLASTSPATKVRHAAASARCRSRNSHLDRREVRRRLADWKSGRYATERIATKSESNAERTAGAEGWRAVGVADAAAGVEGLVVAAMVLLADTAAEAEVEMGMTGRDADDMQPPILAAVTSVRTMVGCGLRRHQDTVQGKVSGGHLAAAEGMARNSLVVAEVQRMYS